MTSARSKNNGFTLVEVMIAISIMAMVVGAIYSTWTVILRAAKTIRSVAENAQRERVAMQILEDALMGAQLYEANGRWYAFVAENGPQPMLSFVAKLPPSFPRSRRFGDLELRRVIFAVERASDGKLQLTLRQIPLLMEIDRDEDEFPLVLVRNVQEFLVTFWDQQQGTWVDTWTATNRLPEIVLVSLIVGNDDTSSGKIVPPRQHIRIINLPSRGVPANVQSRPAVPGPLRSPSPLPAQPTPPQAVLPPPGRTQP